MGRKSSLNHISSRTEPRLRLHVAAFDDIIRLERFIQLSIRVPSRMRSCMEDQQDVLNPIPLLRRPENVSPPEPVHKSMLVDNTRLSFAERHRRLSQGLCLYCGVSGHAIATCHIRPPRLMVSAIEPQVTNMCPLTTVVQLTACNESFPVTALIDFIAGALSHQLRLPTSTTTKVYQVQSVTGKPLSRKQVRHQAGPVTIRVGQLHEEEINILVLEDSTADIILGRPWLVQHNPILSWESGEVLKWDESCFPDCFSYLPRPPKEVSKHLQICTTSIVSPMEKQSVYSPSCYAPFSDVFCPKQASKLPPYRPWDCAIDLLPGEPVPRGRTEGHGGVHRGSSPTRLRPTIDIPCCFELLLCGKEGRWFEALHRLSGFELQSRLQDYSQVQVSTSPRPGCTGATSRSTFLLQVGPPQHIQPHPDT